MDELELERLVVRLVGDGSQYVQMINNAMAVTTRFFSSMRSLGRRLSLVVTAPLVIAATLATRTAIDFDRIMVRMQGAANLTQVELMGAKVAVRSLGRELQTGPLATGTAMLALVKGGFSVQEAMKGAAQSALRLSKIGEVSSEMAGETIIKSLSSFSKEGLKASDVANILSQSADASVISIDNMVRSVQMGASGASLAGVKFRDFANTIALLGQHGVIGRDAGTSIKTFMVRLASLKGQLGLESLGAKIKDISNIREVVSELERVMKKFSPQTKLAVLDQIFGSDALRAAAILAEEGVKGWDAMMKKQTEALTVQQKYALYMASFAGQWERLTAMVEDFRVELGDVLLPYLARLGNMLGNLYHWFMDLTPAQKEMIVFMGALAAAAGPVLLIVGNLGLAMVSLIEGAMMASAAVAFLFGNPVIAGGLALLGVITAIAAYMAGTDGIVGAFQTATMAAYDFFVNTVGWFYNLRENWSMLTTWLGQNWWNLLKDMLQLQLLTLKNMSVNVVVLLDTIMRLFTAFQGWMLGMFMRIFTVDFYKSVWEGMKKVWTLITDFLTNLSKELWKFAQNPFEFSMGGFGDAVKQIVGDMQAGMTDNDLFATFGKIMDEQTAKFHSPFEGFQPSTSALPEFNLNSPLMGLFKNLNTNLLEDGGSIPKNILKQFEDQMEEEGGFTPEKMQDKHKGDVGDTFKEINLHRFMLGGEGGLSREGAGGQKIDAPETNKRLDKIAEILQRERPVIGE